VACVALLGLGVAACDPQPAPEDAATLDAPGLDARAAQDALVTADDAGLDATLSTDAGPTACLAPSARVEGSDVLTHALGTATLTTTDRDGCLRSYALASTALRRDMLPTSPRRFAEREGDPTLRTGHDLFDALFAMSMEEARECSVAAIQDGAFDMGRPVPCAPGGCFETGRLWKYVWTRDTSYSVDLGLAAVDPVRARNSLEFKLSERRGGGGEQIVQDTGTGGSYPVSTDRVVWALGARALLPQLEGPARETFRDRALAALVRTIAHDREVVFDPARGLYRGETSFLDWREQSYAAFTANDVMPIAESEALSTNVLHLEALELASRLAGERGDTAERDRLAADARALRSRIAEVFWDEERGELLAFTPSALDRAPARRVDLLATSLAILAGVIDAEDGRRALSAYPHFELGAPVLAPQQQFTAIYHNRGQWPFVTAYALLAAREVRHAGAFTHAARTLVRGAALSLSNMENYDVSSGLPWREDGSYSGPVVNSQRQLWSVAGYLGMVVRGIFGLEAEDDGLHLEPYVTADLASELFPGQRELVLNGWRVRGRRVTVVLHLPETPAAAGRDYEVASVRLDGIDASAVIPYGALGADNRIDVVLRAGTSDGAAIRLVDESDWRNVFGPRTPAIAGLDAEAGGVRVRFDLGGETPADVRVSVYRDGARIASDLTSASHLDTGWDPGSPRTPCYAIETCFASGNCSQHSAPACYWGPGNARIRSFDASAFTATGGTFSSNHGRGHYESWGDVGHRLEVTFTPTQSGEHLVQTLYGNGAGGITTGITCAVKRVVVEDTATGAVVGTGVLVMPQLGDWSRWEDSTVTPVRLEAGRTYRITILGDDTTANMSAFQHFALYTGGMGGASEFSRVNIAEIRLLAR
jgi:glycogen debranching enzyme